MSKKKSKMSLSDKEQQLIDKINKAKEALSRLQAKKQKAIGALACKYQLDTLETKVLDKAFERLAKELINANQ